MKFIKKNIKLIVGIFIGMLIVGSINVYAAYKYFATEVKYDDKSVSEVLDELYANKIDVSELNTLKNILSQTTATPADIANGKKAYSNGDLITGTLSSEKDWTLVITYTIHLGWNGNVSYGSRDGSMTIKRKDGKTTITNSGGSITSPNERWNGNYSINANIQNVKILSFTIDS